tara:strand:+ start:1437 stop:2165 length:729 start_codon:yes stop_codon:yes gene_type:complete
MATTTAKLNITSVDLLSDSLNLNVTSTLTDAGGEIGMSESIGLSRKTTTTTDKYTLLYGDNYTASKAAKLFVYNPSTDATEYFKIEVGGQAVGRVYAGDWALIPWASTDGVKQVFTVTLALTWATADDFIFDGVTVTTFGAATTASVVEKVATTWFPNWTVIEEGGASDTVLRFTARSSNQRENLQLGDAAANTTGSLVVDTTGNGTATVAMITEPSGAPGDVRITPGQAANTVEWMLIHEG